jgi:hypothetical protein
MVPRLVTGERPMGAASEYLIPAGSILTIAGLIGVWLRRLYQLGFDAGVARGQADSIRLSEDHLLRLHWLATSGFYWLLMLGARGYGGFQDRDQAEKAHWTLEQFEWHLTRGQVDDQAFDREGAIRDRWPDGPLSSPRKLLKQWSLEKES